MGSFSIWHWILVLAVGLLLFGGRGKISELMGDFAKGIKSFKQNIKEDERPADAAMTAESAPPAGTTGHISAPLPGATTSPTGSTGSRPAA